MKDLTRFEYLQLAAAILPKEQIAKLYERKTLETLYEALAEALFEQAEAIQSKYTKRYQYETSGQFCLVPDDEHQQ